MAPFFGKKVVTYHNSWSYLLKRFGLAAVGYIEPKPGIPPNPAHLKRLIDRMGAEKVQAVLVEPYFDNKAARFVAESSGAAVVVLPPSASASSGIRDYFQLFDFLTERLTAALR